MSTLSLTKDQERELWRICSLTNTKEIHRNGKLFNTDLNNYFYDTGTGKVILLEDDTFYIMNLWFSKGEIAINEVLNNRYLNKESLKELLDLILNEHLLRAIKPKSLYSPYHYDNLNEVLDNNLEQLILELTGKCNLRCGYCIYNESFNDNKNFSYNEMSKECVKKVVNYFFEHSSEAMSITFYGGEPLLKFDLLKWVIEYSLEKNKKYKKELTFSLTTNLTLVTEDIANYFSKVPGLSVLCSIDGPECIHNSYRKFPNGEGSFDLAIKGLKYIGNAFYNSENALAINAVFAPPYTYDKLDAIEGFFSKLNCLPHDVQVDITYPTAGSVVNEGEAEKLRQNPKYKSSNNSHINPLWKWQLMKIRKKSTIDNNYKSIISSGFNQILTRINDRYISEVPNANYPFNGCCVPAKRRLYVDAKGDFYPCERIGTSPSIGNINSGVDHEKIKKFYIDDYVDKSISECSNCWAIRLCTACYSGRYNSSGFIGSDKICEGTRDSLARNLAIYHELLETDSDKLQFLKNITVE